VGICLSREPGRIAQPWPDIARTSTQKIINPAGSSPWKLARIIHEGGPGFEILRIYSNR
jgi:hypothetical protein